MTRFFARAACLVAACAAVLLLATPASAAPASPVASFNCAAANGDGTFTYFFGYSLAGSEAITIPEGPDNQFPGWKDLGQPTIFSPGDHQNSFSVTTSFTNLQWHLGNSKATADATSLCTNVPVVAEAPAALVMPLAAVAPFALWFFSARRRSLRELA